MELIKICGRNVKVQGQVIRIARLDADKYESLNDPQGFVESLRKSGHRIDIFTFMQMLPERSPKYLYPMEWDNLAVVPISTFEYWWSNQIRSSSRNRARQAEKRGVILREVPFDDVLVRGIWKIYNECPVRQGRPFPHYGEHIETVHKETATYLDSSFFIGAFLEQKLIGFAKLTCDETRAANLMNILSLVEHKDKAPTNALIAQAIRSCAQRKISYLVYQNFSYGKKRPDSLTRFKETNGFQRIDLPRYYVPLTRVGSIALRLGLHHKFSDHFPEPLVSKLREIRDFWYSRRFQSLSEAS